MNDPEFNEDEIDALRKIAKERIAYDVVRAKIKNTWIWVAATGILAVWALWDNLQAFISHKP